MAELFRFAWSRSTGIRQANMGCPVVQFSSLKVKILVLIKVHHWRRVLRERCRHGRHNLLEYVQQHFLAGVSNTPQAFVTTDVRKIVMLIRRCETFEGPIYRIIYRDVDTPGGTECFSDVTGFTARRTQHV